MKGLKAEDFEPVEVMKMPHGKLLVLYERKPQKDPVWEAVQRRLAKEERPKGRKK